MKPGTLVLVRLPRQPARTGRVVSGVIINNGILMRRVVLDGETRAKLFAATQIEPKPAKVIPLRRLRLIPDPTPAA